MCRFVYSIVLMLISQYYNCTVVLSVFTLRKYVLKYLEMREEREIESLIPALPLARGPRTSYLNPLVLVAYL